MQRTARENFTAEDIRRILHYDPRTGIFTWRHRPEYPRKWNTRYAGKTAGTLSKIGYIYIEIRRKLPTKAARLAWLYMTGEWPLDDIVDHRNGVRNDDRWGNLRLATASQNGANKAKQRNNTSGFVGVHFHPQSQRWRARITIDGRTHDLGLFDTAEEAGAARKEYVPAIQGEFAPTDVERERYFHHRDAKGE